MYREGSGIGFEPKNEDREVASSLDTTKCQMDRVLSAIQSGKNVEWESFSPYLSDHNLATGELLSSDLPNADRIGLVLARALREKFPNTRMISLYDEYNTDLPNTADARGIPTPDGPQLTLSDETKGRFRNSIEAHLRKEGIIREGDRDGKEFLLISESSKIERVEELVEKLDEQGVIERKEDGRILFSNGNSTFPLRSRQGRWMCEALDASAFLDPKNLEITHLVILPEHFQKQQDRVWEILRALGHSPENYHNVYYPADADPETVKSDLLEYIDQVEQKESDMSTT
jgi:hypothetical protein